MAAGISGSPPVHIPTTAQASAVGTTSSSTNKSPSADSTFQAFNNMVSASIMQALQKTAAKNHKTA